MAKLRVPVLESYEFQPAIKDKDLSTPPVSPVKGDRYLVAGSATGLWEGKEKNIAWFDTEWKFDAPKEGTIIFANDEKLFYKYSNSVWGLLFTEQGLGDMVKSTYDTDNDGIVDKAEAIDDGEGNTASAADVKDAVTKKHDGAAQDTAIAGKTSLGEVKADTDIADAISKKHAHTNKTVLDAIEVALTTVLKTAYDDAVTKAHEHSNISILDNIEVAFTNALKSNYDDAYSKRAIYDADLGVITFEI